MTNEEILNKFQTGKEFYYITINGTIDNFIVHSGMSPKSAYVLSKVHVLHDNWDDANAALKEYNKMFRTFKN